MTIVKKVFSGEKYNFGYGLLTKPMLKILYEDLLLEAKYTESDFNNFIKAAHKEADSAASEKQQLQERFNILGDNETKLAEALKRQGKQLGDKIEALEKSNEIMADDTLKLLNTISEKNEEIEFIKTNIKALLKHNTLLNNSGNSDLDIKIQAVGEVVVADGKIRAPLLVQLTAALEKLLA